MSGIDSAIRIALVVMVSAVGLAPRGSCAEVAEGFEQGVVPGGWTSTPGECLSVVDAVPGKSAKCLLWKWRFTCDRPDPRTTLREYLASQPAHHGVSVSYLQENVLTVTYPKPLEQGAAQRGLSFWYQSPRGGQSLLRVEILGGEEVIGRGWYPLSAGWRRCGFPYDRVKQGSITGFRILAPTSDVPQWPYCSAECLCMDDVEFSVPNVAYDGVEIDPLDGDAVPSGWDAGAKGTVEMTAQRRFSGDACLRWTWHEAGASLVYANPAGFARIAENQLLAFWVHNEAPSSKQLRLELWSKDTKLGGCYYNLNFRGWHVLAAPYAQIGGRGADRVRLLAPEDAAHGRLHLDLVNLQCCGQKAGGYRPATPVADCVQPWIGVPELLGDPSRGVYSTRDLSVGRPWIPPLVAVEAISPKQMADLEQLRAKPAAAPPGTKGSLPPSVMSELQAHLDHWKIRESDGITTGRPIAARLNPPPDAFHTYLDFNPLLQRAIRAQARARQVGDEAAAGQLAAICRTLLDFAADQGLFSCSDNFNLIAFDLNRFEQAKAVAAPETFDQMLRSVFFGMGDGFRICEEEPPGDTDIILGYYGNLLRIIAWFPDPAERLQKYQALVRGITRICERVDGEPLGPDGTAYHHGMHHWDYTSYELPVLISMMETLRGTDFRFGPAVHEGLKRWMFAMAWSACRDTMPPTLPARPGDIREVKIAELARRLDECRTADGREPPDRELGALYLALTDKPDAPAAKRYRDLGIQPYAFTGHRVLNGAATSIHRRDDWMVAVIGEAVHRRGLEIYGGEKNSSSRFAHNGAVFVVSSGKPASCQASGWSFDGWNAFHYPGATNPLSADPQSIQSNYYLLGYESLFAGGTDLEGDGIWGYEHRCNNLPKHRFTKSAFFFGRRVTVVTTDIEHIGQSDDPFVTTLYQNAFGGKPEDEPTWIDGREDRAFPSGATLPPGQTHWLLDNKGTGYFVHASGAALRIARHPQTWSYFGRATSNVFALAYLDHGPGPGVPGCAYSLLVRSEPGEMAALASAMTNRETAPYRILQQDAAAHVLWDRESGTTGYVLFAGAAWKPLPGESDPRTAPLLAASRPCTAMIREGGSGLRISVASTDWKDKTPMVLTIAGSWKLEEIDTAQPHRVVLQDGATRVAISYDFEKPLMGYAPIHLRMAKP